MTKEMTNFRLNFAGLLSRLFHRLKSAAASSISPFFMAFAKTMKTASALKAAKTDGGILSLGVVAMFEMIGQTREAIYGI